MELETILLSGPADVTWVLLKASHTVLPTVFSNTTNSNYFHCYADFFPLFTFYIFISTEYAEIKVIFKKKKTHTRILLCILI